MSIMMQKIIEAMHGDPLTNQKVLTSNKLSYVACSKGKLIVRLSLLKVGAKSPTFLERILGDICGPINPPCGQFRYFMVLIYALTHWLHVCLLSTCNLVFVRLLTQIISLRVHFFDYSN